MTSLCGAKFSSTVSIFLYPLREKEGTVPSASKIVLKLSHHFSQREIQSQMKNIAVLSSGTDNCGINGAIRAIVRISKSMGIRTWGVQWGFKGLLEDQIVPLNSRNVSGVIGKAGCFLGTTRPFTAAFDSQIQQMLANLNKKAIDGLIVIGGGGSIAFGHKLGEKGVPIVGIPSTLQDDIVGTEICIGVDSALNCICKCVDNIRSCDSSRNRSFLVQVEGRECGSLAMRAAITCGSEICLMAGDPPGNLKVIANKMAEANMRGKTQCIAIISAGWKPGIEELEKYLELHENETDLQVRKTILGYVQRGGVPSGYDRILGTKFGNDAVKCLSENVHDVVVGLQNAKITRTPISDIIGKVKPIDPKMKELFDICSH